MNDVAAKVYRRKTDPSVHRALELLEQEAQITDRKKSQIAYELWSIGHVYLIKSGRRVMVADPATTSTRTVDGETWLVIKPVGSVNEILVESGRYLQLTLPEELQGKIPSLRESRLADSKPFLRAWEDARTRIQDFMR